MLLLASLSDLVTMEEKSRAETGHHAGLLFFELHSAESVLNLLCSLVSVGCLLRVYFIRADRHRALALQFYDSVLLKLVNLGLFYLLVVGSVLIWLRPELFIYLQLSMRVRSAFIREG